MTRRLCLITGASAGIGAAFAEVYAANGYDLALTARREDRLRTLADDLHARFGVRVIAAPADLSQAGAVDGMMAAIAAQGGTVDVLVNNAGYGLPGLYARTRWSDQQALLQVLLNTVCELTHKVLPGMIDRGYGRIVNVASLAGLVPGLPSHTLYGPSKAFVVKFSQGLHTELLGTGVHVTALCPGFTRTEFHDANGTRSQTGPLPGFMWETADVVARAGYAAVEANRAVEITGWPNRIIAGLAKLIPDRLILTLVGRAVHRMRQV
jgi:short-subunit dehydrogenase